MNGIQKYIKKFDNISWNDSIKELHKQKILEILKKIFIKDLLLMKFFQHF